MGKVNTNTCCEQAVQKTPEYIQDRGFRKLIDELLKDNKEELDYKKFDPYSLDSKVSFFESRFVNGVKELDGPTKLKSATKGNFYSEIVTMRTIGDQLDLSPIATTKEKYLKINIEGYNDIYYIKTDVMRKLIHEQYYNDHIDTIANGLQSVVTIYVDLKFLQDNCVREIM